MIRSSYVVLALLGMTGLALAQPPPPPGQPPPPPPMTAPPPPMTAGGPPAAGDAGPAGQNKLGLDLAFVMPVDEYADGVDAALGLFGRVELALNPQMRATGRIGFLRHFVEEQGEDVDLSITMIPIYAGLRFSLSDTGDGGFLAAEVGLNNIRVSASFLGTDVSDSETKASLNAGGGFQAGSFSFTATVFFTPDVGDTPEGGGTNLVGLMATLGFDLATL